MHRFCEGNFIFEAIDLWKSSSSPARKSLPIGRLASWLPDCAPNFIGGNQIKAK